MTVEIGARFITTFPSLDYEGLVRRTSGGGLGAGINIGYDFNIDNNSNLFFSNLPLDLQLDYIRESYTSSVDLIPCREHPGEKCLEVKGKGDSNVFRSAVRLNPIFLNGIFFLKPGLGPLLRIHDDKLLANELGEAGTHLYGGFTMSIGGGVIGNFEDKGYLVVGFEYFRDVLFGAYGDYTGLTLNASYRF